MRILQLGALILILCWTVSGWSQTITVVTEEGYPLQYTRNQKIVGTGTELVEAVLNHAGLTYTIQMYPWARAYEIAQKKQNVLIYSMTRTPEREALFKWVGEILPMKYSLFRLTSRPDVAPKTVEDAKRFEIGVIRQDVIHHYLEQKGFANLQAVTEPTQNFKKLLARRVDLIPYNISTLQFVCKNMEIDCDLFEPVLPIEEISSGLYMAFSRQTDDALVKKARNAYRQMKQNGTYMTIMGRTFRGEE